MPEFLCRNPRRGQQIGRCLWALALLLTVFLAGPARAATYGDITVTIEEDARGESTHGYVEIWILINNRSDSKPHEVTLKLPRTNDPVYGGDYLRAITRTVSVQAGQTSRVFLAYPANQVLAGSILGVAIDGREAEEAIVVRELSRSPSYGRSRSYGYGSSSSSLSGLVLMSKSVDLRFKDSIEQLPVKIRFRERLAPNEVIIPGGPGSQPVAVSDGLRVSSSEVVRSNMAVSSWSPNWLGYSRYDAVVLTADDLRAMPADVRTALGQYVECGGTLFILGTDPPLPGHWKPEPVESLPLKGCAAGFGYCLIATEQDYMNMDETALTAAMNTWQKNAENWPKYRSAGEANKWFPVVDDMVGVPVWGLLALMVIFAIVIGPVNLVILSQRRRRLWLFWTVPLISFFTCVMVLGYMVFSEGNRGKTRIESFTLLDENSRRATTVGWQGVYTPMLGGGGLHFNTQTEVSYQNEESLYGSLSYRRPRTGSPLTIDWTQDQHLVSGWQTPRVPSHFVLRKSETRRERVTIRAGSDGRLEATNGLGAEISDFWYLDEKGKYYSAQNIPAGGRAALNPAARPKETEKIRTLRTIYNRDWYDVVAKMKRTGPEFLTPRTYLAILSAAPFLDESAMKESVLEARSVVFGIVKEGNDGG